MILKNVFKRSLTIFLSISIIFSSVYVGFNELDFIELFAVKAKAADSDILSFELNDDGKSYYVYCSDRSVEGEIVIPDTYNDLPVTHIDETAFAYCMKITNVIIPESVISIGYGAFKYCHGLQTIIIPDSVVSIGDDAFWDCQYIETAVIGNSVVDIGEDAFYHCLELTSLTIGESVESIGKSAFDNCESLETVYIPESVSTIGEHAFSDCNSLVSFDVDESNANFSSLDGVLFNKDKTTLIKFPANKETEKYTIMDGVINIYDYAFYECDNISYITIPNTVENIGDYAFAWCDYLYDITFGNGVKYVGDYAFSGCDMINHVRISDMTAWCEIEFISEKSNPLYYAEKFYLNGKLLEKFIVPDDVTHIGNYLFVEYYGFGKVVIPESVTTIDKRAFFGFDGTVYCTKDSTAHKYASANNIYYVLVSIFETENTNIDYKNFLIKTSVREADDIIKILGVSESAVSILTASHVVGNHKLYGTGTIITVYDSGDCIGDYTLIVEGDLNGDSVCDVLDCAQANLIANGHQTIEGAYAMAADSNEDNAIDASDYQDIINRALR